MGDCPTMCIFMLDTSVAPFLFENTADLMKGATGLELTPDDVQRVGERVNNLARAFNTLAGLTRADDDLPERLKTEPIPEGPAKGQIITQADLDLMLDEYYEARGWTPGRRADPRQARGAPAGLRGRQAGAGLATPTSCRRAVRPMIAVKVRTIGLLQALFGAG